MRFFVDDVPPAVALRAMAGAASLPSPRLGEGSGDVSPLLFKERAGVRFERGPLFFPKHLLYFA